MAPTPQTRTLLLSYDLPFQETLFWRAWISEALLSCFLPSLGLAQFVVTRLYKFFPKSNTTGFSRMGILVGCKVQGLGFGLFCNCHMLRKDITRKSRNPCKSFCGFQKSKDLPKVLGVCVQQSHPKRLPVFLETCTLFLGLSRFALPQSCIPKSHCLAAAHLGGTLTDPEMTYKLVPLYGW